MYCFFGEQGEHILGKNQETFRLNQDKKISLVNSGGTKIKVRALLENYLRGTDIKFIDAFKFVDPMVGLLFLSGRRDYGLLQHSPFLSDDGTIGRTGEEIDLDNPPVE